MVRWVWASVLAITSIAVDARAQPLDAETLPVVLRSADGAYLRVQGEGIAKGAGLCFRACSFRLAPGVYTVSFPSGGSTTLKPFTVNGPSEVVVSGGSSVQRGIGLALLIGGGTVATAGAIVAYADLDERLTHASLCDLDASQCYHSPAWVLPAEIAGGVGLGVALVGVVVFLTAKPSASVSALREDASARPPSVFSRMKLMPELGAQRSGLRLDWSF
jgi:hypothetical protein